MYDEEDGGYRPTPAPANVTIEGLDAGYIVDQISEKLIARWGTSVQKEIRERISQQAQAAINEATSAAIADAVREVLAEGFQETDRYGTPNGPKRTLRDIVAATLTKPDRDYSGVTMVSKIVSETAKAALQNELKAEMEAARAKFRESVDAVLNAKLQEALRASLGIGKC